MPTTEIEVTQTTTDGPGDTTVTFTICGRLAQGIGTAWADGGRIASGGSAWLSNGLQFPTDLAPAALVMGY